MTPPDDERDAARRAITARRERFMKAALASAGIAAAATGCDPSGPVCHAVRRNVPSIAKGMGCHFPGPCLSVEHVPIDAGPASTDAGPATTEGGDGSIE